LSAYLTSKKKEPRSAKDERVWLNINAHGGGLLGTLAGERQKKGRRCHHLMAEGSEQGQEEKDGEDGV